MKDPERDEDSLDKEMDLYAARGADAGNTLGFILDFSPDSVAELERLFDERASRLPDELVGCLGAYFGVTILRTVAGRWTLVKDEYGEEPALEAVIEERDTIFPMNKVWKRVQEGKDHDIAYFYDSIVRMKRQADAGGTYELPGDIVR